MHVERTRMPNLSDTDRYLRKWSHNHSDRWTVSYRQIHLALTITGVDPLRVIFLPKRHLLPCCSSSSSDAWKWSLFLEWVMNGPWVPVTSSLLLHIRRTHGQATGYKWCDCLVQHLRLPIGPSHEAKGPISCCTFGIKCARTLQCSTIEKGYNSQAWLPCCCRSSPLHLTRPKRLISRLRMDVFVTWLSARLLSWSRDWIDEIKSDPILRKE